MATTYDSPSQSPDEFVKNASVDALVDELEKADIESSSEAEDTQSNEADSTPSRPRIVYTRRQLLYLSQSPLVRPPDGMPTFKSWFGELNEQSLLSTKKESETPSANGTGRERRYRREAEDGDGSTRPPFRSTLSQPSQMGNFKHQPLRASDRDRDRDTERDLRSLSDKYDRERGRGDRIGLPTNSTLLRNRDRDSAPHLASADRDAQRPSNKKRNGESKEDWRRGAEPPRTGRDEHHTRRERDDRERPRSRARDSSRQRDSPPSTRRDRDRDDHRRDRDRERFVDADEDNRRWRDDGKREERMSGRRDKDRLDRDREKGGRDRSRDPGDDRDYRDGWSVPEDRQKRGARDRRNDDGREREDRREREKEKEPAWMETYVPPATSSTGILGGKGAEGEVDSIQAWKKDMKEREMKAKGISAESSVPAASQEALDEPKQPKASASAPEAQLDEIQLFKLMMKQEEQKRVPNGDGQHSSDERSPGGNIPNSESGIPGLMRIREGRSTSSLTGVAQRSETSATALSDAVTNTMVPLLATKSSSSTKTSLSGTSLTPSSSATSALGGPPHLANNTAPPAPMRNESNGPRLLSLKTTDSAAIHGDAQTLVNKDVTSPSITFDPPRQSRLLAFGAHNAKTTAQPAPQSALAAAQMGRLQQQSMDPLRPNQRRPSVSPVFPHSVSHQSGLDKASLQQHILASQYDMNVDNMPRRSAHESAGPHSLTFENAPRSGFPMDASREFANNGDMTRSSSIPLSSASDRAAFISPSDALHHLSDVRRNPTPPTAGFNATSPISPFDNQMSSAQSTYSTGKGSRMAKHFEKARESHTVNLGRALHQGMGANGAGRQVPQGFNNALGGAENRNIDDLLTMLNNSAQRGHQVHPGINQNLAPHQPPPSLHMGPSGSLGRHDNLLDPDEGRFAPDGLVPGLRPAPVPAPRNRDVNGNMYANQLDDSIAFNARLGPQQRAGMEQLFSGPIPSQFNGQGSSGGRGNLGFQQQAMRGGPSPINNFNPVQGPPHQRLPPGLANLGGRPPHEPSQFIGGGAGNYGVPSQLHASLQHSNNPQSFNQFQNPNLGIVGNQGHIRGQPGLGQLGNPLNNGLNGVDFRGGPGGPPQNQMLGLGGHHNVGQGMRSGPGFNAQQLHAPNQLPPSMNHRQQHNLPPQILPQMLPHQLQQHGIPGGQHTPSELMALLMGGAHRE
ncbi:hypothetical protein DFH11DRAFT_1558531 [Phellopilus nigrolimitatus]|nr:hypothetical protein DFH11DRAFT_1558531 [Phellopilus nigrolimitatus]